MRDADTNPVVTVHRPATPGLPSGTVTFLFTDIEGSTPLIQRHGDAMQDALARHHSILDRAIDAHHGRVFNVVGDAFCSAFADAAHATAAAIAVQRALHAEDWGRVGALRVRIGLHTGLAEVTDGEYLSSLALVRAQRVMAAGHGGQTLLSRATAESVRSRLPAETTLRDLGVHKLRGLTEVDAIFEVVAADLPSEFPPLRVDEGGAASAGLLRDLVRGQLVGRATESAQLEQHWHQAQQARGHLVLLSGEPGVGKTRLAQELIAHVQQAGATLMRGGCYEYEATTPYLPFIEAFRQWAHRTSTDQLRSALGGTAPEIAKLAPEIETKLGPLTPNAALPPNDERLRLFDNVARLLQALAASRGLLLFVDDLHWADQGTLSLLHYLLRNLRHERVLVLGAYRELELDRAHPLARELVDWNRERLVTRIPLSRLSHDDTCALLATLFGQDTVSADFASVLYRETEGNPFFIEEVVKSLIEQGEIYRGDGEWNRKDAHELTLPQSVKEAIGRRLDRLSEPAADALRTAAALGKIFSFRELAAVLVTNEDQLLDALDEANGAQLIRADDGKRRTGSRGDGFAFTHDKIREVLYEELNPIRRRRLHLRIGETLERLYGGSAAGKPLRADDHAQDLAYHFTQAGDLERSLMHLQQAAGASERVFAHDEALKHLEQAREAAEALRRTDDVAALDERIGDIHVARGTIRPAIEHYERALATAKTRAARAELMVKVGNAGTPIGDPQGLARLEEALVELDPATQPAALALATASIGRHHHYRAQHRKSIEFLDRARQLAEPLDDPSILGRVYGYLAGAHQHLLAYEQSDHWARASIDLGERRNLPGEIATGYEFLSENAGARGLWDDAARYAELNEASGRKSGSLARVAWSGFGRAQALWGRGRLEAARDAILDALVLCEQMGEARLATWLESFVAIVLSDLGEPDNAHTHAKKGWDHARHLNQIVLTSWAMHGLGYAAMMRDDIAEALRWYEPYVALVRDTENNVARALVIGRAAEAFLRADRLGEAETTIEQALAVAALGDAPHYRALARQVQGRILAIRGRTDDARAACADAIETFTSTGSRLELARTVYHRAALKLQEGDVGGAREDAVQAIGEFTAMGAAPDRTRAVNFVKGI